MLVGCAVKSVGRQSCTNWLGIWWTSGWHLAMTFEVCRHVEIGRQTAGHWASASRFQRTSPDDQPIPQLAWKCPHLTDLSNARQRPRLPIDASMIEKFGRASEKF